MIDLHTHSTASDGTLAPADLVREAAAQGLTQLALTDHDTLAGLSAARAAAAGTGLRLVPGVELSVRWEGLSLHIVGLNVASDDAGLAAGLVRQQAARLERARAIAERLRRLGCGAAAERALADTAMPTRAHFARALVATGDAADTNTAFRRWLRRGRPAYVPGAWVSLAEGIAWIRAAGGIAVLAHPLRYALGSAAMKRLLGAFRDAGGEAIEVVSGNATPHDIGIVLEQARRFGLLASAGSDFHAPAPWLAPGRLAPLPATATPVWSRWT
ncbi:MAG TPA: PHP domain-containing protein [Gammaproteobacteria bacterium]|nr:PHP domain-containing protein [Gammaproteobacteria bacterium]